jgi:hypothetical protein
MLTLYIMYVYSLSGNINTTLYIYTEHFFSLVCMKVRVSDVLTWIRLAKEDESSTGRI